MTVTTYRVPRRLAPALLLIAAAAIPASSQEVDVVEEALADELDRSMKELRLEELERPYFISYRVDDVRTVSVEASLGSLLSSGDDRNRYLAVELRVGDYDFDNTNFLALPSFGGGSQIVSTFGGVTPLPLDDDYREIRRQVWLATDAAYKQALEDLAKKKAALENKTRTDDVPDFSHAETVELRDETAPPEVDRARGERVAEELSKIFLEMPHVATSSVGYDVSVVRTRYVNSEGTTFTRTVSDAVVAAKAATQAEDGRWVEDSVTAFGRTPADLPEAAELAGRVREMGERLADLRRAELLERYNGPVLFEPAAAAELLSQVFVPKLLAQRRPVTGDERLSRMAGGESDFKDRLGARVLPRNLSLSDDPTATAADGHDLYGGYPVDDEGVVGSATKLVERGFLKTLLADRTPVEGVAASTGNQRSGGVTPSNLIFQVERDGMTPEELRRELLVWVADRGAEYGVVVETIGNPFFQARGSSSAAFRVFGGGGESATVPVVAAYKVYPDGREELLRNVEISGLSVQSFREIVAAGAEPEVVHRPFQPATSNPFGRFSRQIPLVSMAVPSLLFEELTLKKPSGEIPQPPAVESPLARR